MSFALHSEDIFKCSENSRHFPIQWNPNVAQVLRSNGCAINHDCDSFFQHQFWSNSIQKDVNFIIVLSLSVSFWEHPFNLKGGGGCLWFFSESKYFFSLRCRDIFFFYKKNIFKVSSAFRIFFLSMSETENFGWSLSVLLYDHKMPKFGSNV